MIFSTEVLSSSTPISIIAAETSRPAIYSNLPCPKGCSLSGFCPASLNPIMVITELPASARLLNASAVTATDFARLPAMNFPAKSRMFSSMPTAPQSTPYARRVAGSSYSLGVLINSFARNFSIFHLTNAISVIDYILNRINVMALRGAVHAPQSTPYARRVAGSSYSLGVLINSFARNFSIF